MYKGLKVSKRLKRHVKNVSCVQTALPLVLQKRMLGNERRQRKNTVAIVSRFSLSGLIKGTLPTHSSHPLYFINMNADASYSLCSGFSSCSDSLHYHTQAFDHFDSRCTCLSSVVGWWVTGG